MKTTNPRLKKLLSKLSTSHLLIILGCAIAIGVVIILPLPGIKLRSLGFCLLLLICPAMHLVMMKFMHGSHNHGGSHARDVQEVEQQKQIEESDLRDEGL